MAIVEQINIDEKLFRDFVEDSIINLDKHIERIVKLFCIKQDFHYEPDMWVSGDIGSIICISDLFVNFSDIRLDLEKNVRKGMFSEWYWAVLESDLPYINYNSWVNGLRHSDLKKNENGTTN